MTPAHCSGLTAPWSIHVTIDDGFYQSECPSNDVFVTDVHGAPSVEEKNHWVSDVSAAFLLRNTLLTKMVGFQHPLAAEKAVSDLLLVSTNWKRLLPKGAYYPYSSGSTCRQSGSNRNDVTETDRGTAGHARSASCSGPHAPRRGGKERKRILRAPEETRTGNSREARIRGQRYP